MLLVWETRAIVRITSGRTIATFCCWPRPRELVEILACCTRGAVGRGKGTITARGLCAITGTSDSGGAFGTRGSRRLCAWKGMGGGGKEKERGWG